MIYASMTLDDNGSILAVTQANGDCLSYFGNTVGIDFYENEYLFNGDNYINYRYDLATFSIVLKPVEPIPIAILQAESADRIDALAGMTRLKYITVSAGQDITYTAKLADAKAYIAAGYPADAAPYTWVNAEALATGTTATVVANLINYMANLWGQVGAAIESQRIAAKNKVSAALTDGDIQAAEQVFIGAMAAL
ncbi:hypothetical protein [Methylobacter sp. S3L5C]|uniref:hypothetical protein n=1 Tax=Methylobacter sp. S3L5C TaxID=2839024 RepID=UPI001FADE46D|nr:hypothetical protein [Methylobacter sp. S3L5C]UOA07769.1 hypothetical protein KKZ03_16150 [Methylobacter sp. S3L5C]